MEKVSAYDLANKQLIISAKSSFISSLSFIFLGAFLAIGFKNYGWLFLIPSAAFLFLTIKYIEYQFRGLKPYIKRLKEEDKERDKRLEKIERILAKLEKKH
jgi:hypothetical protein